MSATIYTAQEITLVTLQRCSANMAEIEKIFDQIAQLGVNVDMISMAPAHGAHTDLSFTISDADLVKILGFTKKVHEEADIHTIVSSGNCKITVSDPCMQNTPGVASAVFSAAAKANADLRIITTSEVEISLLVTEADFETTLSALESAGL